MEESRKRKRLFPNSPQPQLGGVRGARLIEQRADLTVGQPSKPSVGAQVPGGADAPSATHQADEGGRLAGPFCLFLAVRALFSYGCGSFWGKVVDQAPSW
ncbi:hypothetical protein [Streptomyces sp. NPDC057428]|uniref:hypothetical protein n=1 Tax=Streptomyces sp. NPDC057428 TaxID=3346129 RepID=UPI00367D7951